MTERLELTTSDGVTLEARLDSPDSPQRITVFCHAHPLHGGTMNSPLMIGVARRLNGRGHAVLRFNFRGTGSSTGAHDDGDEEQLDIDAAVEAARSHDLPLGVIGWSFGASTSLNWIATRDSNLPWAGIAPPPEPLPSELPGGPKRIILGTRDQVVDRAAVQGYANQMGIDLVLTAGDHFFHGRGDKIGDLVGEGLED